MSRNRKLRRAAKPDRRTQASTDVQALFHDALDHLQAGRIPDAVALYERGISLKPDSADAHNNMGVGLAQMGRIDEARAHFERAIDLNPDYADAHNNLANSLAAQGRLDDAIAHFERACALEPGLQNALRNLGAALVRKGRFDDAAAHYRRTLTVHPENAEVHNELGNVLMAQGRLDDAMTHYGQAIAIRPAYAEAHYNRAVIKTFHAGDPDVAALEALAARDDLPPNKAPLIHFALAKALEDCEDYAGAFAQMRKGNDSKRRQITYDEPAVAAYFKRISAVFDSKLFERFRNEGDPSPAPIFVLGMPRSGSTLIEQILSADPRIHGAGERTDIETAVRAVLNESGRQAPFPECVLDFDGAALRRMGQSYLARLPAAADGKIRIVDKTPANFLNIGLIRLILPNAKIVHTVRDPMDTCVSCYSTLFTMGQEFSYDLAELGRLYRRYTELMAHWRSVLPAEAILDVSYEDVVADIEGQARRLMDYCGLSWDDRCLSFDQNSRPVKTASAVQVRKPLFRSSLQRWRRYEAGLAPLLRELGAGGAEEDPKAIGQAR